MGYWGWRPLVLGIFISAWVVGCSVVPDTASPSLAPSNYPEVTLTVGRLPTSNVSAAPTRTLSIPVRTDEPAGAMNPNASQPQTYVVRPGDTLAEIAAQFGVSATAIRRENADLSTLTPGQTLIIPVSIPLLLLIYPPTCYGTRPDNLICLGIVENPLDYPVEGVAVDVRLLRADGEVYLDERSSVEQTSIPAGGSAAYQALFPAERGDYARADAEVIDGLRGIEGRFVKLEIEAATVELLDGRTLISATLINPNARPAELQRAFVTLIDGTGRVTGYRIVSFQSGVILAAGARFPLRVELTPQADVENPEVLLTVEASVVES